MNVVGKQNIKKKYEKTDEWSTNQCQMTEWRVERESDSHFGLSNETLMVRHFNIWRQNHSESKWIELKKEFISLFRSCFYSHDNRRWRRKNRIVDSTPTTEHENNKKSVENAALGSGIDKQKTSEFNIIIKTRLLLLCFC